MKLRDFPATIVLLWIVLLVHVAQGSKPDPCAKRQSPPEVDHCDHPHEFCASCPQRNTRSTYDIARETIDQAKIVSQHIQNYETEFARADSTFSTTSARNMAEETIPKYLQHIEKANLRHVIEGLYGLEKYITEVRGTTTNNYDKSTLCDMCSRIQSTLDTLRKRTACRKKRHGDDEKIKKEFNLENNSSTEANRQRKVIYTIFCQLFQRLITTFDLLRNYATDTNKSLDKLNLNLSKIKNGTGSETKSKHERKSSTNNQKPAPSPCNNTVPITISDFSERYRSLRNEMNQTLSHRKDSCLKKALGKLRSCVDIYFQIKDNVESKQIPKCPKNILGKRKICRSRKYIRYFIKKYKKLNDDFVKKLLGKKQQT